jgi:hypothetical protein
MVEESAVATPPAAGWRLKLGAAIFGLSIALPVVGVPAVAAMGLSAATTATVSGATLAGSEVLGLAAVAVMGKSGFAYLKSRIFGFLKPYGPPAEVSRARYMVGLVMFAVPIAFGWLAPYAADMVPSYQGNELTFAVVGDLFLLASLFVLGGDFWDKLRALFVHDAKALFAKAEVALEDATG